MSDIIIEKRKKKELKYVLKEFISFKNGTDKRIFSIDFAFEYL